MTSQRFTDGVTKWKEQTERTLAKNICQIIFSIFDDLVMRTPVDTGRARASWRIGIGAPDMSCEPPGESFANPDQQKSKLEGIELQELINAPIYITNSVEYIKPLELGHSKQAPQGIVNVTAAEWNGRKLAGFKITAGG